VLDPFTEKARFDWERYREVVAVFTRMLDNVVEINGLPLREQRTRSTTSAATAWASSASARP
jgi:ribonucleoside-diphosphate reductase alpha chain